jgi:cytochrome P450 family 142 subfamily A polypeptide 1
MADHPTRPDIKLLDGNFYAAGPHDAFTWMLANAPVDWDADGKVWGITLHDAVLEVSRQPELFCSVQSSRPDAPPIPSMINLDDPAHRRRRSLVSRGFTPRRVGNHAAKIRQVCRDLVDAIAPKGHCDFVEEVAAPLPMILIGDLLGVEPEDRLMLQRWSDELIAATSMTATPEVAAAAARAFGEYAAYSRRVVADRRAQPREDLMSVLVDAVIDGEKLSDDDLLQEGLLILVGGNETTRHVLTGGCEALCRNPDQLRALAEDPSRIPVAVEEMLRWVTPIQNMNRTATRDTVLRDQQIRAGDKMLLLYPSANRDARVFADPFRFDAARDPNPHVAFGFGAHFCLGASLARLELRLLFEELLPRIPDLRLVSDAPPPALPSNFIRGLLQLEVEFTPR